MLKIIKEQMFDERQSRCHCQYWNFKFTFSKYSMSTHLSQETYSRSIEVYKQLSLEHNYPNF